MKLLRIWKSSSNGVVNQDADALMEAHGESAYEIARTRSREERLGHVIDANRPHGHWDRVRKEIARRGAAAVPALALRVRGNLTYQFRERKMVIKTGDRLTARWRLAICAGSKMTAHVGEHLNNDVHVDAAIKCGIHKH